jgi:hypothetical protein
VDLIDYFDFIVHIFTPATRDFYALERLWGDAQRWKFLHNDLGSRFRKIAYFRIGS